jgi:hypothetical protein
LKLLLVLLFIFANCGLSKATLANSNDPAAFLRKIDRQLCANFKNVKCNHHKRRASVALKTKRKIKKASLLPTLPPVPVITKLTPVPSLKPERLHQNNVPAVVPGLKSEAPLTAIPSLPVVIPIGPPAPDLTLQPSDPAYLAELKAAGASFELVAQPPGLQNGVVVQPVQLKSVLINGVVLQLPDHPMTSINIFQ